MEHVHCPRCAREVRPTRPSRIGWIALVALGVVFVAMVLASSLIGPFIMFAIPFMALVGFAFGPIAEKVHAPPSCPRCGRAFRAAPLHPSTGGADQRAEHERRASAATALATASTDRRVPFTANTQRALHARAGDASSAMLPRGPQARRRATA